MIDDGVDNRLLGTLAMIHNSGMPEEVRAKLMAMRPKLGNQQEAIDEREAVSITLMLVMKDPASVGFFVACFRLLLIEKRSESSARKG